MKKYNWLRENIKKNTELQRLYTKILRLYPSNSFYYAFYSRRKNYNRLILNRFYNNFRELKNSYYNNRKGIFNEMPILGKNFNNLHSDYSNKYAYFLELRKQPNIRNSNMIYLNILNIDIDFNLHHELIDSIKYQNLYELHKDMIKLKTNFGTLTSQQRIRHFRTFKSNRDRIRKLKRIFNI